MKKSMLSILTNIVRMCNIRITTVTVDELSNDLWAGYIYPSTLGVDDVTKYHWIITNCPTWTQKPQIQAVESTRLIIRTWYMASPNDGKVTLLKNEKPVPFGIMGIPKSGG